MPGVETKRADETGVTAPCLDPFEKRLFADLAGDETFCAIDAGPVLSGAGKMPLRDEETELRRKLVRADEDSAAAPLGLYIRNLKARLNLRMAQTRRFRRSDTSQVLYQMIGETLRDAEWHLDLQPGTKQSTLHPAVSKGLCEASLDGDHLFGELTQAAWIEHSGSVDEMTRADLKRLMRIEVPDYTGDLEIEMTYTEFTGFTRGSPEDLLGAFGKDAQSQ